jgi:prolipoprotein diacylglyceryltransferase
MTVYPFTLKLGPIAITGYGIMMMVAFLMAGWAMQLELRRRQLDEEFAADIVMAAVIGGLVGAKVWYVLITGQWGALLSRGGLVWYGGFFGGVAAVLLNGWPGAPMQSRLSSRRRCTGIRASAGLPGERRLRDPTASRGL